MNDRFQTLIKELIRIADGARNLHRLTKVGASTFEDWADGKSPTLSAIERAAPPLGLTVEQLLCFRPLPCRYLERLQGIPDPEDGQSDTEYAAYLLRVAEEQAAQARDQFQAVVDRKMRLDTCNEAVEVARRLAAVQPRRKKEAKKKVEGQPDRAAPSRKRAS